MPKTQTICIELDNTDVARFGKKIGFIFSQILKTSRPGFKHVAKIWKFKVCPLACLKEYIEESNILGKINICIIPFFNFVKSNSTKYYKLANLVFKRSRPLSTKLYSKQCKGACS